jgi:16S rRNA C967 or C1407 C5-methylase (RsmB/RsmF family)
MELETFLANTTSFSFCDDTTTSDHLFRTVLAPLSLDRLAFARPPKCTNVRLITARAAEKSSMVLPAVLLEEPVTEFATPGSARPIMSDRGRHWRAGIPLPGLPECVVIEPIALPPSAVSPRTDASLVIVVDVGCAEAVLRGSDVFAAGVLASTRSYEVGETAQVVVALNRPDDPLKGSFVDVRDMPAGPSEETSLCAYILVGRGVVAMPRTAVVSSPQPRGVAVRVSSNPYEQPPSRVLGQLLSARKRPRTSSIDEGAADHDDETGGVVFLQNYSSMVPVALLFAKQSGSKTGGLAVLDACAAPGGKSSHILSRAASIGILPCATAEKNDPAYFSLTCAERSAARCKALEALLRAHVGPTVVARHVQVRCMDFNQLPKSSSGKFDLILLDPPCTGLGLRPKLRPHASTIDGIRGSADYQKKLLRSACELLRQRRGSRLVYSTCTISIEENEDVVAHALTSCPSLKLAVAETAEEQQLLALARSVSGILTPTDAPDAIFPEGSLVLRFGPCSHTPTLDSVGFFVAVFDWSGPTVEE